MPSAPTTSADFDRAYRAPVTLWGDVRIPSEIRALASQGAPRTSLELGCGLGRFSSHVAEQGIRATAVDFSPVAIERAKARVADRPESARPTFLVGDVTNLAMLEGPFDMAFDVGCFHCLDGAGQKAYARETARLLAPGATLLVWTLDDAPSDIPITPSLMRDVFAGGFEMRDERASRRRLVRSHWYWMVRR